jgi:hypothetical protein
VAQTETVVKSEESRKKDAAAKQDLLANAAKTPEQPVATEGRLVWTGDLDTGQEIDLGSSAVASSVSGSLPGVPVVVEVHPNTVRIVSPPGAQNGWRHLVLHNDGKKQVLILVKWAVLSK